MATLKLSRVVIMALKADKELREKIRVVAGNVTERTVSRWISDNDDTLTKAAIVQVIERETGLTEEQILEESERTTVA